MKAVLGLLLILVGFTVGWLVITGKLPPTTTSPNVVPGVTPDTSTRSGTPSKNLPSPTPTVQQLGARESGTLKQ